jgi:CheY-like chemotaxis protein
MTYKIAVVEDNPDNRMLVQALLEDTYEISEYETGVEAINGLGDNIPDLILLAISLPEMDGTGVLAWIRDQDAPKDIPVIALSAHAMSGDRDPAERLEAIFEAFQQAEIGTSRKYGGPVSDWRCLAPSACSWATS